MLSKDIIGQSAKLRGEKKFDESINLIESNISKIDADFKVNAWLEAFYAAQEKGDIDQTKKYALLISAEEPDLPSIQPYLPPIQP